jgi:hypothetical protein
LWSTGAPAARGHRLRPRRAGRSGFSVTETLRDLIGKRVLAGLDPVDGILGMGMF